MVQLRKDKKSKILQSKRWKLFSVDNLTENDSALISFDTDSASSSYYRMCPKFVKDPKLFNKLIFDIFPRFDELMCDPVSKAAK